MQHAHMWLPRSYLFVCTTTKQAPVLSISLCASTLLLQRASAPGESTTLSSHPDGAAAAGGGDNVVSAQPAGAAAGGAVAGGGGASRYLDRSLSMPSEGGEFGWLRLCLMCVRMLLAIAV